MNPPFTIEQFLEVFGRYNESVWPLQILFNAAALLAVMLAARPGGSSDRWIAAILVLLWTWMAVVYHWSFFATINPAAVVFGGLFLLQAGILFRNGVSKARLEFRFRPHLPYVVGAVLIVYALLVYPVVGALAGHGYPRGPTFGVPCPTTIFTFGLLLWARPPVPLHLLVIPAAWSLLGLSAALSFTIVEDFGLIIAGVLATTIIVLENRRESGRSPDRSHTRGIRRHLRPPS